LKKGKSASSFFSAQKNALKERKILLRERKSTNPSLKHFGKRMREGGIFTP